MAKEDVYIKNGVILRGKKATEELARKDAEEVIRESGVESHARRKTVTLRLGEQDVSSAAKMHKMNAMSVNATGVSSSGNLGQGKATAHGTKVRALNATGEGRNRLTRELGQQAHPGASTVYQTGTGRGEHESHKQQSTVAGDTVEREHNTEDAEQVDSSNVQTTSADGTQSNENETNRGRPDRNNSSQVGNSSAHLACSTEHKESSSRYQTRDRRYHSSSTGKVTNARRHTATNAHQANSTCGSQPSENKDSTEKAASMSRHTRSSSRHGIPGGPQTIARGVGCTAGSTKHKTNRTTGGEHVTCGTRNVMKSRKSSANATHTTEQATRLKGCKNTSGGHNRSGYEAAIKSSGSTGRSATGNSSIHADQTAGVGHNSGGTGQAVKGSEHMISSREHRASHMDKPSGGWTELETRKSGSVTADEEFNISTMGQVVEGSGHMPISTEDRLSESEDKKQSSRTMAHSTEQTTSYITKSGQGIRSEEKRSRVSNNRTISEANDTKSAAMKSGNIMMSTEHDYSVGGDERVESKMEQKHEQETTEGELDVGQRAEISDHMSSHRVLMNTHEGNIGNMKPYDGEQHISMSDQTATHQNLRSLHAGQSSACERNVLPDIQQSGGSAATHCQNSSNPDHQLKWPTIKPGSVASPSIGLMDTDHELKMPSNDGKKGEQPEKKETVDYNEMLATHVRKHVHRLQLLDSRKTNESEKKELPSSRQEAKQEMIRQLKEVCKAHDSRTKKDESEASGTEESNQNNGGSQARGSGTKTTAGEDGDAIPKSKVKPFGTHRNIHTLGCFQNETSKKVTRLSNKVHGFAA